MMISRGDEGSAVAKYGCLLVSEERDVTKFFRMCDITGYNSYSEFYVPVSMVNAEIGILWMMFFPAYLPAAARVINQDSDDETPC